MYSFSEIGMFHYFECPHKVYVTRKLDRIEKREQNLMKFNVNYSSQQLSSHFPFLLCRATGLKEGGIVVELARLKAN